MSRTFFQLATVCALLASGTAWGQSKLPITQIAAVRGLQDDGMTAPAPPPLDDSTSSSSAAAAGNDGYDPCAGAGFYGAGAGYGAPVCGWFHRIAGFGEFMFLRPRDSEVAYAATTNGPNNVAVPGPLVERGRLGVVDPDYTPAFRAGIVGVIDANNAIGATYSRFETNTTDFLAGNLNVNPIRVINPLVIDPAVQNAQGLTFLRADGALGIDYDMIDIDYRSLLWCNEDFELTLVAGVRYARMTQSFAATYRDNNTAFVGSQIDFEGLGLRTGMEVERYLGVNRQFYVQAKGYLAFLAGEFDADYRAGNSLNDLELDTSWTAGRVVTQTDLELAVGWRTFNDTFRIQVGYLFSAWYNVVKTNEFIHTVQESNFADPSTNYFGRMTFDGLTARAEFRW